MKDLKFVTYITSTITKCEFSYVLNNQDVFDAYEGWKENNPGPYDFRIEIMNGKNRWKITS